MSPPHRSSFLPTNGAASIFLSTSPMPGWRSCPTSPATSNPSVPARSCRRSSRSRCPAVTLKRRWGCCNVCNCPSSSSRTLNTNQEFVCVNGAVFPPCVQIIVFTKEEMKKANLSEQAMISIIWTSLMSSVEWNKKEELVTEQAIKHLKVRSTPWLLESLKIKIPCSHGFFFNFCFGKKRIFRF